MDTLPIPDPSTELQRALTSKFRTATAAEVTPANAATVLQRLTEAATQAARDAFAAWLLHGGEAWRSAAKRGPRVRPRRHRLPLQNEHSQAIPAEDRSRRHRAAARPGRDAGRPAIAPLVERWGTVDQSMRAEVRAAAVFLVGHVPPAEAAAILA